jgi:hypothetical protein
MAWRKPNPQTATKERNKYLEQAKDKILNGNRLIWRDRHFVRFLSQMINAYRETNGGNKQTPAKDPHAYQGLINQIFLIISMNEVAKRTGEKDNRFIPASAFSAKSKWGFLGKKGGKIKVNKKTPVFYPIMVWKTFANPDHDPSDYDSKPTIRKKVFANSFGVGHVVNAADTNLVEIGLLPPLETKKRENPDIAELRELCEKFPQEHETMDVIPCYSPLDKKIRMPGLDAARDSLGHYCTWLHELAHQVGDLLGEVRSPMEMARNAISEEELIAELTASYVLSKLGYVEINDAHADNSVAYCQGWLEKVKSDPEVLIRAIEKAQHRGNIILKGSIARNSVKNPDSFSWLPKEKEAELVAA